MKYRPRTHRDATQIARAHQSEMDNTAQDMSDEGEEFLPPIDFMRRRLTMFRDPNTLNTPVNYEKAIETQVNMTRLRCCLTQNKVTAEILYSLTQFRARSENTVLLRSLIFSLYAEKSKVQVCSELTKKVPAGADGWNADSRKLPPLVQQIVKLKETVPAIASLTLAMQQLVVTTRGLRWHGVEHPEHDVMADAEMYFHHFDYTRKVLTDIRAYQAEAPLETQVLPPPILDRFKTFLINLLNVVYLDSHNRILRRMWYENYMLPVDVERMQYEIGPEPHLRAQRAFAIANEADMNKVNRILSEPLAILVEKRTDRVYECCILISFCSWVSNFTSKQFEPSIHTLHDARSARPWSILFMFKQFYFVDFDSTFVGPFTLATAVLCAWATRMHACQENGKHQRRVLRALRLGLFDAYFRNNAVESRKLFTEATRRRDGKDA
jgi:hypothetical protein